MPSGFLEFPQDRPVGAGDTALIFLPNILSLLIIWEFHTIYPNHTHSPFHPDLYFQPSLLPQKRNRGKKNRKHQVQFPLPIYTHWSTVRLPVASLQRKIESFPTCTTPEAANCGELRFSILITTASCLVCFSFGEKGLAQKPPMSLILNYESVVIDTSAKEASLPITAGGGMDRGLPYGARQQHGSWTLT